MTRTLVAVLASPPLTSGVRTLTRLAVAARILGCTQVQVANLFSIPTQDIPAISQLGAAVDGWWDARPSLELALEDADVILAGWGLDRLTGLARTHRTQQLSWLGTRLREAGHQRANCVDGGRHPSRWHQYVSDRHGRVEGSSFEERLRHVLLPVAVEQVTQSAWPALRCRG